MWEGHYQHYYEEIHAEVSDLNKNVTVGLEM